MIKNNSNTQLNFPQLEHRDIIEDNLTFDMNLFNKGQELFNTSSISPRSTIKWVKLR